MLPWKVSAKCQNWAKMLQRGNDVELCDTIPAIPTASEDVAVIVVALAEDEEADEPSNKAN